MFFHIYNGPRFGNFTESTEKLEEHLQYRRAVKFYILSKYTVFECVAVRVDCNIVVCARDVSFYVEVGIKLQHNTLKNKVEPDCYTAYKSDVTFSFKDQPFNIFIMKRNSVRAA